MDTLEDLKILADKWLHQGIKFVQPTETKLFAATGVVLLTIIMLLFDYLFRRKKPSSNVLFSGLSGSGKTVLFNRLRDGSLHHSAVTSMELDEGTFVLHTEIIMSGKINPVRLVDVPGHPRFRYILEGCLPRVAAVVFVVDSLAFLRNCQAASKNLYDILTNPSVVTNRIPLLLCCNKREKVSAHSKDFICKQMERELEKLRSATDIANNFTLGIEGEVFCFSHCRNIVKVAETSGLTGETDQVQKFIREHVIKPIENRNV